MLMGTHPAAAACDRLLTVMGGRLQYCNVFDREYILWMDGVDMSMGLRAISASQHRKEL
jgi:hypothetical protein